MQDEIFHPIQEIELKLLVASKRLSSKFLMGFNVFVFEAAIFLFLISAAKTSFAEKPPIKFGKIDKADLEMKTYDKDTSAIAVVLCDYGYLDTRSLQFTRILRVKILKKEGLSYADRIYQGDSKTMIRGKTYNLENGKIVEDKLKNESIFRERVTSDLYRLRVAMPNVKVGSVFDIQFTSTGIPDVWYFQQEIPVVWSELVLPDIDGINFRKNFTGYVMPTISEQDRWVAKDVPAFKKEPFLSSYKNYVSKFEFDLLSITIPGLYREFTTSWKAVAETLGKSENFGVAMRSTAFLNHLRNEISEKDSSDYKKMIDAYAAVKEIKWNKEESVSASKSLGTCFKDHIGNSADINLTLTSLLDKLGIKASPVVLSSRDNGFLSPVFPSINKLNYVISIANVDDKTYLLDATEKLMPAGLLPERCFNNFGQIMLKDTAQLVKLDTKNKERGIITYNLKLNEDNNLNGTISEIDYDYAAFNFRKNYETFNSQDEYLEQKTNDSKGLNITDYSVENLDSIYKPVIEKYSAKINDQVYASGDKVYINTLLFNQMKENPFKSDDRKYPVEYAYLPDHTCIVSYQIPDGYSVNEVPKQAMLKLAGNGASFIYSVSVIGNKINIMSRFKVNKHIFAAPEYANLKKLYNLIVQKEAEPIILNTKKL